VLLLLLLLVMKMNEAEIRSLVQLAEDSWRMAGNPDVVKSTDIDSEEYDGNVKKIYYYGDPSYAETIRLAVLKNPVEGFKFLVHYPPTNVTFGFKNWRDADFFARMRKQHVKAIERLMG